MRRIINTQWSIVLIMFGCSTLCNAQTRHELSPDLKPGKHAGDELVNSIGQFFCWCPPGGFKMGSPVSEVNRSFDEDQIDVTLTQGFWMSKFEVTEREYKLVTKRSPKIARGDNFPMVDMKSGDARRYADNLTKREYEAGQLSKDWSYSFPTEAQWEYACRAGSRTAFSFGDSVTALPHYGNFADRSLLEFNDSEYRYANSTFDDGHARLAPVGSFKPNLWGLHDMHGNVWEWCTDRYATSLSGGIDPGGPEKGDFGRVIRGGSWLSYAHYCRSAMRQSQHDLNSAPYVGIRVILIRSPELVE